MIQADGAFSPELTSLLAQDGGMLGGFELIRRIGSGGMGVVYLAREAALGRMVALKLVRPEHLLFPEGVARFGREVKAVAALRHPGIVPVFSVGQAQGIPFFTMEWVAGANLQQVLDRLAGSRPERLTGADLARVLAELVPDAGAAAAAAAPERSFGRTWQEVCLRLVRQVALALDHVHAHGILHRDIKPSNIMVTPAGRVMLVDFGLAATPGAGRITRSGAQPGSLPYMAPEQLEGDPSRVDARTDIHALGVTLFELLTLSSPHLDADAEATRRRILHGGQPQVRERNRAVTWDAETVCLTAMERDPARRYRSARALATDLDQVLEFGPIAARRPGPVLRLRRLAQRRPAVAVGVALGSVLLLLAPLAWGLFEHQAFLRVETERQRAEHRLEEALRAVNQMLTRVGSARLQHVPQSDPLRRELLEDALAFCRRLAAEYPSHPRILAAMAAAQQNAGWIQAALGDRTTAEQSLLDAVDRYRSLLRMEGGSRSHMVGIATAGRYLSNLLNDVGRPDEAATWMRSSLGYWQELARRFPEDIECAGHLGTCWANLGCLLSGSEARAEADQALRTGVELLAGAVAARPDDDDLAKALLAGLTAHGFALLGRPAEAEPCLRRAIALAERLADRLRDDEDYLGNVASARTYLGDLLDGAAQAEAEQHFRAAVAIRERMVAMLPGRVEFLCLLGQALNGQAAMHMRRGEQEEAQVLLERAIHAQQRALATGPQHVNARRYLHIHRANLAAVLVVLEKPHDALALAEPAAEDAAATRIDELVLRADLLCVCIGASRADDTKSAAERAERSTALAVRAVACLRRAVDAGLRDEGVLARQSFNFLRRRDDYRQVIAEIEARRAAQAK